MAKYLACGNTIYDTVESIDGVNFGEHLGGQAMYATSGIRLWTKDVKMVTNCGLDYKDGYGAWLDANGLTHEGIRVNKEYCSHVYMKHTESGAYELATTSQGLLYREYFQGFFEMRPEDIEAAIGPDTKGIYHHLHSPDRIMFGKLEKIREKYGVKTMWEIMYAPGAPYNHAPYFDLQRIKDAAKIAGTWSLNRNEATDLFNIPRDNDADIINELMKFDGVEMCYYRCGSKGAYVVTPTNAYFCPLIDIVESIDPMGCGNCSTGTAMYAWCETGDPLMTAIISAISAGYNASQSGPWPLYTPEDTLHAQKLAKEYYDKLKVNYPNL